MKYFILLTLILMFSCSELSSKYFKVSDENINKTRLEFAKQISHKLLSAQSNESYHKLSDKEATSKMVTGLTKKKQQTSYELISGQYGNYQDLEFNQLLKPKDGTLYEVYRFKGKFSSKVDVEIRTTLDGNGKLAGIYMMKWKDNM